MTYCVGILVKDGLVMLADTRTNAGIDNISTFRKLHTFEQPGKYALAISSSGNLSIAQSVFSLITDGLENPITGSAERLTDQQDMFKAAQFIGRAIREVYRIDGPSLEQMDMSFDVNILLGGQIGNGRMRLFNVYAAGNFIEVTPETVFMQIGEHKYGKPILDRAVSYDSDPYDALKIGLISMDSTMRSNLSVDLPIDMAILKKDMLAFEVNQRITEEDEYFSDLRERWSLALQLAHADIPLPPYGPGE